VLGVGIIRLIDFVTAPQVAAGRLQPILTDFHKEEPIPLHAVYLPGRYRSLKVAAMVDFLLENFAHAPWRKR
jgi:DNA-binding transcriptional LysR family regulator